MFEAATGFWPQHIILSNLSHAAGGFGLAIVLQRYLRGEPFLPVIVGWDSARHYARDASLRVYKVAK